MCMWSHPAASRAEHARAGAENDVGFAVERVEMDLHTGTHIDALGHCVIGPSMHRGLTVDEAVANGGLTHLGIDTAPPIIARGILLDMPAAFGRALESGEAISVDAIRSALERADSEVEPGDVVLIRTGWARYSGTDNERFLNSWPGIGIDAARWLADQKVIAVGADTHALEVWPPEDEHTHWPVHQEFLVRAGIYIIEHANLEELARHEAYRFLCLCLPIRFVGGTASPVRLTAIV